MEWRRLGRVEPVNSLVRKQKAYKTRPFSHSLPQTIKSRTTFVTQLWTMLRQLLLSSQHQLIRDTADAGNSLYVMYIKNFYIRYII